MELILSEEEYYDLFKSLRKAIEELPDIMKQHKDLLTDMTELYMGATGSCEFVITRRYIEVMEDE